MQVMIRQQVHTLISAIRKSVRGMKRFSNNLFGQYGIWSLLTCEPEVGVLQHDGGGLAAELQEQPLHSGRAFLHEKNLSGLSLQSNAHSLLAQLPRCGVHFKDSETEDARRLCHFLQGGSLVLKGFKV